LIALGDDYRQTSGAHRIATMRGYTDLLHGALERTVHHPLADIPGSRLLQMRVTDDVIRGGDLATALGLPGRPSSDCCPCSVADPAPPRLRSAAARTAAAAAEQLKPLPEDPSRLGHLG
jgi:hypothetical protein